MRCVHQAERALDPEDGLFGLLIGVRVPIDLDRSLLGHGSTWSIVLAKLASPYLMAIERNRTAARNRVSLAQAQAGLGRPKPPPFVLISVAFSHLSCA